ncbi:VC0807 family protein [Burkholderia oklahomensis]|uniref:VC0807 family protein n=1 Tax=Burkholderia oklahomensis TaxID=342113 RepID=UPI00264AD357|nr:VC0807 family protein [Burkholderia oklahomensis]MDN7674477.1 VC0807 family protein [Burkholderia oklahomensis]
MKIRPGLLAELTVNLLLPWAAYRAAAPYWGETGGLIASAVPPLVWSALELARFRRVDALSALVLLGIVLSIAAALAGGSPRMLLMRESLVSGAIGVAFLVSLALQKPLVFHLARATVAREAHDGGARLDQLWAERPAFVSSMRLMTLVWGGGLVAENLLRAWIIWNWPVERALVVAPFVGYGIYGALMMWTLWYRKVMRAHALAGLPPGGALG